MNSLETHLECSDFVSMPSVTLAMPIYNEESVLPELLRRTGKLLDTIDGGPHQIVLVDDGSTDSSLKLMKAAAELDPRLVVVSLSRNFGHQAAIGAAFGYASGDVVIVMDGDLQDPPEVIPDMLAQYRQGYDVVYAIRVNRKENWLLRTCYSAFYRLISNLTSPRLPEDAGDFALLSKRVVQLVRESPERNRYLRGLRTWYGFAQKGIEIERSTRHSGRSKYSIRRLFGLAFDGIFAFSILPIRVATFAGLVVVLSSFAFAAYSLYAKFFFAETQSQSPAGFTALIFSVIFLGGMQMLFLGLIGEYIARIYDEVKRRPHFVVDKVFRKDQCGE